MTLLMFSGVADASDEQAIRDAEQQTHDQVRAGLPGPQVGPIEWRHYAAADAPAMLDKAVELGAGPEDPGLREFLASNPKGLLIVTACNWRSGAPG